MVNTAQDLFSQRETDQLNSLFKEALASIKDVWIPKLMPYLESKHPEAIKNIKDAETTLEKYWMLVKNGYLDVSDFQEAVSIWQEYHFKAIEQYKNGI